MSGIEDFEPVEAVEELAEETAEELFPPKPGGLIDRHRQRIAADRAREEEEQNARNPIEERAYRAIKVASESPEDVTSQTILIQPGQTAQVLPRANLRVSSDVLVVTSGAAVIIARDSGAAFGALSSYSATAAYPGFTLPAGIIKKFRTRGQVWAANPGDAAVQVSVMSEYYAPAG